MGNKQKLVNKINSILYQKRKINKSVSSIAVGVEEVKRSLNEKI